VAGGSSVVVTLHRSASLVVLCEPRCLKLDAKVQHERDNIYASFPHILGARSGNYESHMVEIRRQLSTFLLTVCRSHLMRPLFGFCLGLQAANAALPRLAHSACPSEVTLVDLTESTERMQHEYLLSHAARRICSAHSHTGIFKY